MCPWREKDHFINNKINGECQWVWKSLVWCTVHFYLCKADVKSGICICRQFIYLNSALSPMFQLVFVQLDI